MRKYFNNIICALAVPVLIMLAASCGSSKKTLQPSASPGDVAAVPATEAYRVITDSYNAWQSVSMPVKFELVYPKRVSISGRITMVYDKAISVSLRFFGMEVARLYADNDSVFVLSKMKDMAFAESISSLTSRYGITLADLQCLLLGQMFVPGQGRATARDLGKFRLEDAGEQGWAAWLEKTPANTKMLFVNNYPGSQMPLTAETTSFIIGLAGDDYAGARYDDFTASDAGIIAGKTSIEANIGTKEVQARLIYQPGKARWNEDLLLEAPAIPSGSKRVSTESLLKIISGL